MNIQEITQIVKRGKTGMLPNYKGYFRWDYANDCMYMENGDYKKYDLQEESKRSDFYYII